LKEQQIMNPNTTNGAMPLETSEVELDERKIDIARTIGVLLIACMLGLIGNWVATGTNPIEASPGMAILFVFSVIGILLAKIVPFYLPSVAWISLVAIIATIPGIPGNGYVLDQVDKLNFLALATPALAYGGLALTQSEFRIARTAGWKIVIVAICVMLGTYIGSVVVADLILRIGN
jgi:hypothetical protein